MNYIKPNWQAVKILELKYKILFSGILKYSKIFFPEHLNCDLHKKWFFFVK